MTKRKEDCCEGEPCLGDPRGMHSLDCPVYLASMDWLERQAQLAQGGIVRAPVMPGGESTSARLRQVQADLAASQADLTHTINALAAVLVDLDEAREEIRILKHSEGLDVVVARAELASARQELSRLREDVLQSGLALDSAHEELGQLRAAQQWTVARDGGRYCERCPRCGERLYSPAETDAHNRLYHNVGPTMTTSWGAEP